jgi:hypothetical protein
MLLRSGFIYNENKIVVEVNNVLYIGILDKDISAPQLYCLYTPMGDCVGCYEPVKDIIHFRDDNDNLLSAKRKDIRVN